MSGALRRMRPKRRPSGGSIAPPEGVRCLSPDALDYLTQLFNVQEALEYLVAECDVPEELAESATNAAEGAVRLVMTALRWGTS